MEGGRVLLDASSYMLIEASGDSESEFYDTAVEAEAEAGVAAAEDDAESCSCGSLSSDCEIVHETHGGGGDNFLHGCAEDYGGGYDDDDGGVTTEVEDGVVDQCRGGAAAADLNKLNKGCEDSNMNEREMDRLFWEACLAS